MFRSFFIHKRLEQNVVTNMLARKCLLRFERIRSEEGEIDRIVIIRIDREAEKLPGSKMHEGVDW